MLNHQLENILARFSAAIRVGTFDKISRSSKKESFQRIVLCVVLLFNIAQFLCIMSICLYIFQFAISSFDASNRPILLSKTCLAPHVPTIHWQAMAGHLPV
jgi:hypothetical protein